MAALAARLTAAAEAVGAAAPGRLDAARGAAVADCGGAQAEAPGLAVGAYASRSAGLSASRSMASRENGDTVSNGFQDGDTVSN